ncbi:PTS sugar transporter subunit IIC [Holzapfeliella sp. He02]|uniref:PTS sugar transporter subunit IIC n=1 Tax=Holzapfeliella saturejae TaxID=3082953 RepID=A0ABU8SHS1_9LACO
MKENTANQAKKPMDYVYQVSAGVSNAILVCLGIGLLLQSVGKMTNIQALYQIGTISQVLLGPAIGVAIAACLNSNTLVIFSAMISSTIGANSVFFSEGGMNAMTATGHHMSLASNSTMFTSGQPISAVAAGLIAALVGNYLTGKTPLDMMLVPLSATVVGTISGLVLAAVTTPALVWMSKFIYDSVTINPVVGSIAVAVVWAIFMMTPASSAALAIAIMLDPVSSGAALIGTTAQFVGYTVMSFNQNNLGANIAQGLITPKVQFANLLANPRLAIPPMIAAIICAPIATVAFGFTTTPQLAGLGLTSLIAPINLASTNLNALMVYIGVGMVLPAIISYVVYKLQLAIKWVEHGQLKLKIV